MVQQEGKMVLPSRRRQAVQASSYNKMQASSLNMVLSSRRRLMQDDSTVSVSVDSASPTTTVIVQQVRVLPSRRSLMQDISTVVVIHSVVATARASC